MSRMHVCMHALRRAGERMSEMRLPLGSCSSGVWSSVCAVRAALNSSRIKLSRVEPSRAKSSQVEPSQAKSSQVESSHVKARQLALARYEQSCGCRSTGARVCVQGTSQVEPRMRRTRHLKPAFHASMRVLHTERVFRWISWRKRCPGCCSSLGDGYSLLFTSLYECMCMYTCMHACMYGCSLGDKYLEFRLTTSYAHACMQGV